MTSPGICPVSYTLYLIAKKAGSSPYTSFHRLCANLSPWTKSCFPVGLARVFTLLLTSCSNPDGGGKFWDEVAAESETKAKVVPIFKDYNAAMEKAGRLYRYS